MFGALTREPIIAQRYLSDVRAGDKGITNRLLGGGNERDVLGSALEPFESHRSCESESDREECE